MKNQKKDYLINELRSYNYLMAQFDRYVESFVRRMKTQTRKLEDVEDKLNGNGYVSPTGREMYYSGSRPNNDRIIELLSEQEKILKRMEEIRKIHESEIKNLIERLDYIHHGFDELEEREMQFIIDLYIHKKGTAYMMKTYFIDFPNEVYRISARYLGYMIYGRKRKK